MPSVMADTVSNDLFWIQAGSMDVLMDNININLEASL